MQLQRRGLKLNPITTLYYIAPCCFMFLLFPFIMIELPKIRNDPSVNLDPVVFFSNAAAAFGETLFLQLTAGHANLLRSHNVVFATDWA